MDPSSSDFRVSSSLLLSVDIHTQLSSVHRPALFFGTTTAYLKTHWSCVQDGKRLTTAAYDMSWGRAEQYRGQANPTQPHTHTYFKSFRQTKERRKGIYNLEWNGMRLNKSDSAAKEWLQRDESGQRMVKGNFRLAADWNLRKQIFALICY